MPSQQEVRWSQLKVGLIVLVASVVLVTLLFLMTSSAGLGIFSHKLTITTYFENSAGLKPGAAVNLQGVTIGTVKTVTVVATPDRKLTPVRVVMKLNDRYADELKKDSKASLTTIGVLGDTVVDINSQFAVGPPLRDGDELKTLETPSLTDVVKASQGTIESLNVILAKMNTIVDNLQTGKGSIGQLINNPDLYNNSLMAEADAGKGGLGLLVKDPKFRQQLDNTVTQVNQLVSGINQGRGTLGKLATEDTLHTNMNNLLTNSSDLVTAVRQNPKKYLTIHLKIF
jgi:phospholipid/cholesterol/gamma-HCH transport system substrate-binding protein